MKTQGLTSGCSQSRCGESSTNKYSCCKEVNATPAGPGYQKVIPSEVMIINNSHRNGSHQPLQVVKHWSCSEYRVHASHPPSIPGSKQPWEGNVPTLPRRQVLLLSPGLSCMTFPLHHSMTLPAGLPALTHVPYSLVSTCNSESSFENASQVLFPPLLQILQYPHASCHSV